MDWLKKQHRALWQFYRTEFSEELLITAISFLVICLLTFGLGLLNKDIPTRIMEYFSQMLQDNNVLTDDGRIDLLSLLGNNLRATGVSILYGFIPFLYLTALALGVNAMILGFFAAYYVNNGFSLLAYFAGILPHGVFELSAMLLSFSAGLLLCKRITCYVRKNEKGVIRPFLCNVVRLFMMHVLPLLVVAALVEAYVTPIIFQLFI